MVFLKITNLKFKENLYIPFPHQFYPGEVFTVNALKDWGGKTS